MSSVAETTRTAADIPARTRRRYHRAWYVYDFANSAYYTTTYAVLLGPYLTTVAGRAACPDQPAGAACLTPVSLFGLSVLPGSLAPLVTTLATVVGAVLLPLVGAAADRSPDPRRLMAALGWTGAAAATAMGLAHDGNWQLLVLCQLVAVIAGGASITVYDSLLVAISTPDERDGVSSRGWAMGYVGGFILLVANLAVVSRPSAVGLDAQGAVRLSLAAAGIWWAAFTLVPWWGLRNAARRPPVTGGGGILRGSFRQLRTTLADLRHYPQTARFLLAALFFNDGVQTVIGTSSLFAAGELGLSTRQLVVSVVLVQFVAVIGAVVFARLAARVGSRRAILASLAVWGGVGLAATAIPRGRFDAFLALAFVIGLVLGGTQALGRSLFSQLVPAGREAEYFALYEAAERGTSWLGTIVVAGMYQVVHSYRPAVGSLVVFFLVGAFLVSRVRVREGIVAAGNPVPTVI